MPAWRCVACHESDVPRYATRAVVCELCRDSAAARSLAWCSRCKRRVNAADLAPRRSWCRACERARNDRYGRDRAAYGREWRAKHPTANQDYKADPATRARYAERAKARYWSNPDKYRAMSRISHARHLERCRQYARLWRARNRAHSRALGRESYMRRKLRAWQGVR